MTESDDLIREFLIESHQGLDRLDRDLVDLEKDPRNRETLASVFRAIHTIKGTCGFFGLSKLESVSHVGESVLSRLRDGELILDAPMTTALLGMVDAIREILGVIEVTGAEGDADYSGIVARLQQLDAGRAAPARPVVLDGARPTAAAATSSSPPTPTPGAEPANAVDASDADDRVAGDDRRHGVSDSSLRVDVALADKLMNLVGELVLARNQLLQCATTIGDASLVNATQRLSLVMSELQDGVMQTRLQPIGDIWSKLPRLVRDLASLCGKQVRIEMEGTHTSLDRAIIDAIRDPLTHIIRNAIDHGIEPPAVRVAQGKRPEGTIRLRACHEGSQVVIEISDDGAGIALEKVRQRAIARGLVSTEQSARLSDRDVVKLIFLPGFSTSETVTSVSGRGVGMDVVRTNIEMTGGSVDIESVMGAGTTLRIRIPLTLAIIPALVVCAGGERFAIPQGSVLELLRLDAAQAAASLERIGQAPFYRWRGNLLPLVYLHSTLGLTPIAAADAITVVVLKADQQQFGLVVETVIDTQEIVVKPLGRQLEALTAFTGATIMGDGAIALIVDVLGLAQMAHVVEETRSAGIVAARAEPSDVAAEAQALLVFTVAGSERMALPLSLVTRLEEFPKAAVERFDGRSVVQYRGEILPLVSLASYFAREETTADLLQVVVCAVGDQHVGLIVEGVVDIVQQVVTVDGKHRRPGLHGAAVLQQQVTGLLDVETVIVDAGLFDAAAVA